MKKKLLFAALCVVGAMSFKAYAQTDVTSTYITNPGFEGDYKSFFTLQSGRDIYKPVGWSVQYNQTTSGDKNTMSWIAESQTNDGSTWIAKTGKSYMLRSKFANLTLYLRQTMENLRPGNYTLKFQAVGYTSNANNNSLQVSVAGETKAVTMSTTDASNWNEYSIDFTITEETPYATIEVKGVRDGNLFKMGIDDFTLTYDGSSYYETILAKAQSLYDDNADWAENGLGDFAAAITANTGKTTIEDKNTAIVALEEAMATFKAANSVDMTAKITNPNFDSNIDGWTCTGGDGNGYQRQTSTQTNFTGGFLEKWRESWNGGYNQKNFEVYQTLSSLPNGEYTVKAYILAQMQGGKETLENNKDYKEKYHGGPFYIDDNKGVWFYATSGEATANTWANSFTPTFGDTGGGVLRSATVKVENGSLTIGFKGIGSTDGGTQLGTYANWIACDTWTLSYFGFDPTTLKAQITSLQAQASSLLANEDYANVVGQEKTDLTTASTLEPEDEKKSTLEAAITQIETAINNFTTAKSAYDAFVTAKATTVPNLIYADDAKKTALETAIAATANTAEEATTKTSAITMALRAYYESHALAEGVEGAVNYAESIAGADPDTNTGWTGGIGTDNREWEQYTDASGNLGGRYYDGGWATNAGVNINMSRSINLPAGKYLLTVTARGSNNLTSYTMSVANSPVNLPKNGSGENVGVFGHGWDDVSLEFTTDGNPVTLTITAASTEYQQWISFNRFRLVRLELNSDAYAGATEYTALNNAIAAAEAKTLGFGDGEYAPYNNVAVLKTLAEAKAINQEAELTNLKTTVESLTATLNATESWAANGGDVDAIYNGFFATVAEGQNYPDGWTRTNVWGKMQSEIEGTYATAYYNQPGSLQYGNQGVYTMPLAANTYYKLTFAYRSNENGSNKKVTVSVLNGEEGLAEKVFPGNSSTSKWEEGTTFFKTGDAGNYVLTLANDGNTWMTGVSITKSDEVNADVAISITAANQYSTFIAPFEVKLPEGITAYSITAIENKTIHLSDFTDNTIPAYTPVLLYAENGCNQTFYGQDTHEYDTHTVTKGFLTGVLVDPTIEIIKAPVGSYVLQNHSGIVCFYKVGTSQPTMKQYRAYLTLPEGSAKPISLSFDDEEATAIAGFEALTSGNMEGIYTTSGAKVNSLQKGVNIIRTKDGKSVKMYVK